MELGDTPDTESPLTTASDPFPSITPVYPFAIFGRSDYNRVA
jgi:hypothetical protein